MTEECKHKRNEISFEFVAGDFVIMCSGCGYQFTFDEYLDKRQQKVLDIITKEWCEGHQVHILCSYKIQKIKEI